MYTLILHGRRSAQLHKLSSNLQNAFPFSDLFFSTTSTAPEDVSSNDGRKGKTFTVESISRKVGFENRGNPDSVMNLLRSYGFTGSQISSIITAYPRLLVADADKSIGPKLQFLQSRGASSSELTEILSKVPKIFGIKKDKAISVYYDFVKEIIEADKSNNYEKVLPQEGSAQENKMRNVLVLRELGVPQRVLFSLLISNNHAYGGKEKFKESLKKVVDMGFDPTTSTFVHALQVVQGMSEKAIEEKVNVCKKIGFTTGDVWKMFKRYPFFLRHSEKKITQIYESLKKCGLLEDEILSVLKKCPQCLGASQQKIDNSVETFLSLGFSRDEFAMIFKGFPQLIGLSTESVTKKTELLVKKMNWSLKAVVSNPAVYGYSLEKRTIPRCNVIKALMSKGLLANKLPPLSSVLAITDQAFLNKYVKIHDDKKLVVKLMAIFTRGRVS